MEYINRKIKINKKETSQGELRVDITDGIRLSIRMVDKKDLNNDILINFTKEETEKIKRVLK